MRISKRFTAGLESSLIQQLRIEENVSRVELARRMKLAPSTVGQYVDRLIGDGFLVEGRKAAQPAGRPPTVLELNPHAGHFVGIDFEARQILAVAVDFAQQPLRRHKVPLRATDDAAQVLRKIEGAIEEVHDRQQPLLGIGLGVPGAVNSRRGIGLHYEHIRDWRNIRLGDRLARRFQVPIGLENNIRAMTSAEQLFGQGRGVKNFICIGIRSGIGAGIVIDGRLHRGPQNLAGEIGGWPCEEGKTLEQLASLRAISDQLAGAIHHGIKTVLRLKRNRVMLEDVLPAALEGDRLVLEILDRAAQVMGRVVAQLNLVLNPEKVIIAGPLGELMDGFVHPLRLAVDPLAQPPHATLPEVVGSTLGEFSGALGGAALAVQRWTPVRQAS